MQAPRLPPGRGWRGPAIPLYLSSDNPCNYSSWRCGVDTREEEFLSRNNTNGQPADFDRARPLWEITLVDGLADRGGARDAGQPGQGVVPHLDGAVGPPPIAERPHGCDGVLPGKVDRRRSEPLRGFDPETDITPIMSGGHDASAIARDP